MHLKKKQKHVEIWKCAIIINNNKNNLIIIILIVQKKNVHLCFGEMEIFFILENQCLIKCKMYVIYV